MLSKLLVIVGPTAVGKTEFAIRIAECLGGEIVSADSRYFYQGMDIGTAKPSQHELSRVPHHLINVTTPDKPWSLAVFQQQACQAITEIAQRGKIPILVGGTGQYIRAVTEAWKIPQLAPDGTLRNVLTSLGLQIGSHELHKKLQYLDPLAASRMDPGNLRRTVRALEVILSTGRKFSQQSVRSENPYDLLTIGLARPRAELYQRIDRRIEGMLDSGFIDEVRSLIQQGFDPDLPGLSAIGYREITAYLSGRLTLPEAVMLIKRSTRQFVRRQANWFKEVDPSIHWFQMNPDPLYKVVELVRVWMKI